MSVDHIWLDLELNLIFFYAPGWNDWGHIVYVLSVCLTVCLQCIPIIFMTHQSFSVIL